MGAAQDAGPGRPGVTSRVLVAVEDSATGLRAAAVAVDLAAALGASLLVVHVVTDGDLEGALSGGRPGGRGVRERRRASAAALLRHVASRARRRGVPVDTLEAEGDAAGRILDAARSWSAGIVVIGRSEARAGGPHRVGAQTQHVMEFAEQPVLVVPPQPGSAQT